MSDGGRPDAQIVEAARRLASPEASVEAVARDCGLDGRELRRRFVSQVGLGPKRLQRIVRFGGLVRELAALAEGRTSAAALAIDLGYADQAHMTREALRISGSSPGGLMRTWLA
jgi:AraC-like DNA-binding protein